MQICSVCEEQAQEVITGCETLTGGLYENTTSSPDRCFNRSVGDSVTVALTWDLRNLSLATNSRVASNQPAQVSLNEARNFAY